MEKIEVLLSTWPQERLVHPIEAEKLPDSVYFFITVFFTVFSVFMVSLFVLVIWVGIYRSVNDKRRLVDLSNLVEV